MENNVTFNMMYSAIVALTAALEANTAALQAKPVDAADTAQKRSRKSKAVEQPVEPETVEQPIDAVEVVEPETVEQPVDAVEVVEPETVEQPIDAVEVVEPETVEQPVDAVEVVEPETEGATIKDVETALLEVKNKHGANAAKRIVVEVGGVTTIKKADPIKYQAMIDACDVLMNEEVKVKAEPEPEVNEPTITLADLKAKASELAKAMGSADKAKQLIAQYGVKKTDDLDPKDYGKLFADLEAALAASQEDDL